MTVERLRANWKPIAVVVGVMLLAIVAVVMAIQLMGRDRPSASQPSPDADGPSAIPSSSLESASPTVTPSPTAGPQTSDEPDLAPTPTATPYVTTDLPLPDGTEPMHFWGRVVVDDLRVRDAPGATGTPVDVVSAGDVVMVQGSAEADGTTWYQVFLGGTPWEVEPRWVAAGPEDDRYVVRIGQPPRALPDTVRGLAAGASGYLAWGSTDRTTEWTESPLLMFSPDGVSWSRPSVDSFDGAIPDSAAWGPGGWVVVSARLLEDGGVPIWLSSDGLTWEQAPDFSLPTGVVPYAVVGSDAGYALSVYGEVPSGIYSFSSENGRTWQPIEVPGASVISTGDTLVAISVAPAETSSALLYLHWFDGRLWLPFTAKGMPMPENPQWAASGNTLLMLDRKHDGSLEAWAGTITPGALERSFEWSRRDAVPASFAGAGLSRGSGGSAGFFFAGWDLASMAPITFHSTDGIAWTRHAHGDDAFGGAIANTVFGPDGALVLGSDSQPGTTGQVLYASSDLVTWIGQTVDPDYNADLTAGGCPAMPRDTGDLLGIDGALGAACFGDQPITLRGYATDCGGCGGYVIGTFEPAWLANPMAGLGTYLGPFEVTSGYGYAVVVHPDVADDWVPRRWLEVTGHFDDPASSTCHMTIGPEYWVGPTARDDVASGCRARFVVTAIEVVDAP